MAFHDFDQYEKLVQAASGIDMNTYVLVLLGGDAAAGSLRVDTERRMVEAAGVELFWGRTVSI